MPIPLQSTASGHYLTKHFYLIYFFVTREFAKKMDCGHQYLNQNLLFSRQVSNGKIAIFISKKRKEFVKFFMLNKFTFTT